METFQQRYQRATMWLATQKTLFAQLMYALPNTISDEVPTAATNYKQRFFNPGFMDSQQYLQQAFVMAHELLHEMLLHGARVGNRKRDLWNYACDIKINNLLIESGFTRPKEGCFDHEGNTFPGMTEEQIYDALVQQDADAPEDYEEDVLAMDEMTAEDVATVRGRVQTAIEMHGMGRLPQSLQEALAHVLNPKEQWYEWLRKYFVSKQYSGCDWRSLCRREYVRSGIIAASFQSDSLGTVVISVDQSGSIGEEELAYFAGHVNSILLDCKPERVIVQYFDTQVHDVDEFKTEDLPITLRRVCGGGTSFIDPCAKAEEYEAVVHIVLTDMYGTFPSEGAVPTIWASTSDVATAPFGDVVSIKEG